MRNEPDKMDFLPSQVPGGCLQGPLLDTPPPGSHSGKDLAQRQRASLLLRAGRPEPVLKSTRKGSAPTRWVLEVNAETPHCHYFLPAIPAPAFIQVPSHPT